MIRIRLNLMPERVLREREARSRRRLLFGVPLIGLAAVVAVYALVTLQETQAKASARNAEEFLAQARPTALRVLEMQQEADRLERQHEDLSAALRQRRQWTGLLIEISRVIPQDAWLTSLTLDASSMTVIGYSLSLISVASFAQNLELMPGVAGVQLQSLQEVPAAGRQTTQYKIVASLREGP